MGYLSRDREGEGEGLIFGGMYELIDLRLGFNRCCIFKKKALAFRLT